MYVAFLLENITKNGLKGDNGLRVEELPVPAGLGDRFFCTPEAPIALAHITAAL